MGTTENDRALGSIERIATEARAAARIVAKANADVRTAALTQVAAGLRADAARIVEANRADLAAAEAAGLSRPMLARLALDAAGVAKLAAAVDEIAGMPDPLGTLEDQRTRENGLRVARKRIPLGVILMIYESRPNVTTDAFALCLRAGNAVILRGGSEARHSNAALGEAIAAGLGAAGLPRTAAQIVPTTDRRALEALLRCEAEIDLVIPRGGEGLIRFIAETSRIPVIKHYRGVCHVFVDAAADLDMALRICENGKVSRPSACNAVETILVHEAAAEAFVPRLVELLRGRGVEVRGDERARALHAGVVPAVEEDWHAEYLDLIVALRVVPSFDAAVAHIERYGSDHTEAIVTRDDEAARRFLDEVQSSTVLVNASTRFADGGELGLGAEIGISTTRLHAYGPMGARELTATKFVVLGDGQVRT